MSAGRTLLVVLALLAGLATPAAAADRWTPVRGVVDGIAHDATADGPRVLVLSVDVRRLIVTTLHDGRVTRRQALRTGSRAGLLERPRIVALPGGAAVAVWQDGGRVASAYRPAAGARFGPLRVVSSHPGAGLGAARAPAVAAGPGGQVVVAWWGGPAGGRLGIWASELRPGGTWSAPQEISAGAYPQLGPSGGAPQVAIGAAASPDGGFAVAWRQPADPGAALGRRTTLVGVTRSPSGVWGRPTVLGAGTVTSFDLTVAAPAAGVVAAAWAEGREQRPDGVTTSTCLVTAVAAAGAPVARADVTCRAQYSPGRVRLVRAADGGLLMAWQVVPDYGPGNPLRAGIELYRLAAGAAAWTPTGAAVANTLGYWDLDAFAALHGGGAILLADLSQTVRGTGGRQLRVVLVRDDGTVERRVRQSRSSRPLPGDKRLFALTTGPYRALLVQSPGGFTFPSRTTLLQLSG